VQYEASELLKALSKYAYLHEAIVESLVHVLETPVPVKAADLDSEAEKVWESDVRAQLRQHGAACKVLGMLSSSHPALMSLMISHGVMAYVINALTTMDYECIQHASGAISSFCTECSEAEAVCEQLLTEPLVYSVKQDHLRFYRELEPDIVAGIKLRAGHMMEVRKEEQMRASELSDSLKQIDDLNQDLNTTQLGS